MGASPNFTSFNGGLGDITPISNNAPPPASATIPIPVPVQNHRVAMPIYVGSIPNIDKPIPGGDMASSTGAAVPANNDLPVAPWMAFRQNAFRMNQAPPPPAASASSVPNTIPDNIPPLTPVGGDMPQMGQTTTAVSDTSQAPAQSQAPVSSANPSQTGAATPGAAPVPPAAGQEPQQGQSPTDPAMSKKPDTAEANKPAEEKKPDNNSAFNHDTIIEINNQMKEGQDSVRADAAQRFFLILEANPGLDKDPEYGPYVDAFLEKILMDPSAMVRENAILALELGYVNNVSAPVHKRIEELSHRTGITDVDKGSLDAILAQLPPPQEEHQEGQNNKEAAKEPAGSHG